MADEKKYNYYKEQLKKLKNHPKFNMQLKIQSGIKSQNSDTHWMDLNPESIETIIIYLVKQLRMLS